MEEELLSLMKDMAREAGRIALGLIDDSDPTFKSDQSVLTKADMQISRHIRDKLKDLLSTPEHILIDEEDAASGKHFDQAALDKVPYVWVVDPIDGTRSFSNRMPLFGISLGVLKELKPWLGVVYFPLLNELFFSNGTDAYFVEGAFSDKEKATVIKPLDQTITQQAAFLSSDAFFKEFDWDFDFCQITMPSCAVIDLCWPAIGRGCGGFFKANLWDFAGSWPIFQAAGLQLRSLATGKPLERVDTSLFIGAGIKTWKLKEHYVLSSKRNLPLLKAKIRPRAK